ncbi:methionine synthase [Clostridiales bacterium PH28_bin88]|nr:methionine synthase [Clostridiales bacterium PH28_bin88]
MSKSTQRLANRKVLAAAIGDCVHVAGIYNFLRLAEGEGYQAVFLGPAVSTEKLVEAIRREKPDLVGLSYRLTPSAMERLLPELRAALDKEDLMGCRYFFGGTPPVVEVARRTGWFEACFDGTEGDTAVLDYLRGRRRGQEAVHYPGTLVERIRWRFPYPVIRHHFGLPSLERSIKEVAKLAESGELDVISLAPDQNAQESFFRPQEMDRAQDGAGGIPVRSAGDFQALYQASRRGNFPLLRSYSGTRDLLPMARMLKETINLAWGAIPLTWYSVLDGRSGRTLQETIREAQAVIRWHAEQGIPVEVNEAHQWSLRDAHDTVAVVTAFLAAYNAKRAGVRHYVAQYMFNNPPGTSPAMDLAKMLAKIELVESLHDADFTSFRETRTGLASLPADTLVAKGHLAASVLVQMALKPHILHVVAHCEADHAATAEEIIEAVKIARGAVRQGMLGLPVCIDHPSVLARKEELVSEARVLLEAIASLAPPGVAVPWADPVTLERAVRVGLLDAPHLRNHPVARGQAVTRIVDGACRAVDAFTGLPLKERDRVDLLLNQVLQAKCK